VLLVVLSVSWRWRHYFSCVADVSEIAKGAILH
jgi:hypothetical protein